MSKPWVMPNYERPSTATFKRGIGSQTASIAIVNGRLLGQASSAADVSALTSTLTEFATKDAGKDCNAVIHEWTSNGFKPIRSPLD